MLHQNKEFDFELTEFNKKQSKEALANNQRASLLVSFFESIDLAAIYTMFFKEIMHKFLEEIGKYFMFPIVAAASLIQAALAWREAYLNGGKTRSVVKAVVETGAAVAITTAVIGSLVAASVFAVATPIIFTATMAAKTIYHAGTAVYYAGKSMGTPKPDKKEKYLEIAKGNAIATAAGLVATAAIVGVFMLGKTFLAGIGLAVGLFSAGFALYKGITSYTNSKAQPESVLVEEGKENLIRKKPSPGNVLTISKRLDIKPDDLRRRLANKKSESAPSSPIISRTAPINIAVNHTQKNRNEWEDSLRRKGLKSI